MEFTHRWIITVFFLVLKNNFVLDSPRRLIGFVFEWIFTFFKAKTKHLAVLKTLGMCLIKIAYRFLTASPRSTAQHPLQTREFCEKVVFSHKGLRLKVKPCGLNEGNWCLGTYLVEARRLAEALSLSKERKCQRLILKAKLGTFQQSRF